MAVQLILNSNSPVQLCDKLVNPLPEKQFQNQLISPFVQIVAIVVKINCILCSFVLSENIILRYGSFLYAR